MRESDNLFDGIITTFWPVFVFVVIVYFGLEVSKQQEPIPSHMENFIERAE